jgi:RNA polymerase sigma factor (sigma-70 family)
VDGWNREPWPDADLVRAALHGEREAFAALVSRHWSAAVALATRVLGSADLGRDAAQEATIAAMEGLAQLRSPERFSAWFCGITLNVARRWLRQARAELPALSPDPVSGDPGPAELAELAEMAATVRAAIGQLANGQRAAVWLFYLQGLTHREVAAELGITVGAVKARLHQARHALTPTLAPLVTPAEEALMTVTPTSPAWADVVVAEVRRSADPDPVHQAHVMVLAERGGTRQLPIWIGPAEAIALALTLESQETPRPLTYQMAGRLLRASGARISDVRITRLTGEVFYAAITIDGPAGRQEIDARPSDAVNLALVTGAPIRADTALLDNPEATGRPEWRDYPTSTTEVAREAAEFREEGMRYRREKMTSQKRQRPTDP